MGAEQSLLEGSRGVSLHPDLADVLFTRTMLEALQKVDNESDGSSEMYEHAWDPGDRSPPFIVLPDRLTARRLPSILTTDCIRGKKGYLGGRHVWEIMWENEERGTFAIVGVATPKAPLQSKGYDPLIGSNSESWGWDIVSKTLWHCGKRGSYPAFGTGFQVPDTFFVILDMEDRTLSFSTSDVHLGVAFTDLPKQLDRPMCPVVNAIFGNCDIRMRYMGRGESIISNLRHPSIHRAMYEAQFEASTASEDSQEESTESLGKELDSPDVVEASKCYQFACHKHGENVAVTYEGKKAKRVDPLASFCDGVVITSEPLKDNELFEVRLDSKVDRWNGSLDIGATTNSSSSFATFPKIMVYCTQGSTFMWTEDQLVCNKNSKSTVKENTDKLTTGDRIGVMRKSDNSLHFYLNGKDIGNCFKTIPDVLYGVVDIYGQAEQVTITGGTAETQSSNDGQKSGEQDQIIVMVQMKKVIKLMKMPFSPPGLIIEILYNHVLEPYIDAEGRAVRQRYGDHLADIGAVPELKTFLGRLDRPDLGMESNEGWIGMSIVRNILWYYSDASLKFAKEIGKCGILGRFVNDLQCIGPSPSGDEKKKKILDSAVNTLHNCAKATENRQVFRDINAVEVLAPFLKCEDSDMVISALLAMSYITEDDQKHLLDADTETISQLREMLVKAANSSRLTVIFGSYSWSALEIVSGIANIAVNEKNRATLIDKDVIPPLFEVLKKGGPMDKESSANALWVLANAEQGKKKIREHPGAMAMLNKLSKNSNKSIAAAAERVLLRIKQQPMQQGAPARGMPRKNCAYMESCRSFIASLNLDDKASDKDRIFDHKYDKCYCTECHASRNEKLYYTQGSPAKDYALPIGWARFALRMERTALLNNCDKDWHVAYHGTSPDSVKPILKDGKLLMPGDETLEGRKLSEADGHYNDDHKPEGFNTKQIFVSPSIRYSGLEVYAKSKRFEDPQTKKTYKAKVAFQLWIKPDSYKVGQETVGAEKEIDPKFSNQEIEWATARRNAIHLYGVLVRLEKQRDRGNDNDNSNNISSICSIA